MRRQVRLIIIAVSVLCIGVLIYMLDRQAEYTYFIPDWLSFNNQKNRLFGNFGNQLPTFIHVYVFILLTAIVTPPSTTNNLLICSTWFFIDSLFEIAQIKPIAQWIVKNTPDWFMSVPLLENTTSYFSNGTFDALDLLSILAGTIAAYITLIFK